MTTKVSPRPHARLAGLLYLIIAVAGAFAIAYVPSQIIVAGDAAGTANNLLAKTAMFRSGIVADVVVIVAEIAITVLLYFMLIPVSAKASMIAMFARFGMVAVMAVNLLMNVLAYALVVGAHVPGGPGAQQSAEIAMTLFQAHQYGVYIWGILFGLHLLFLGWLVCNSGYLPRLLGGMMWLGSFGYMSEGLARITFTENGVLDYAIIGLLTIATLGELAFALWLLIKGVNQNRWREATA